MTCSPADISAELEMGSSVLLLDNMVGTTKRPYQRGFDRCQQDKVCGIIHVSRKGSFTVIRSSRLIGVLG
jgi:hypothetical protein